MIRLPAIGRPIFRCRLCGWLGEVAPRLAEDQPLEAFPPILGLPEWAMHPCDGHRVGVADLVGFNLPNSDKGED